MTLLKNPLFCNFFGRKFNLCVAKILKNGLNQQSHKWRNLLNASCMVLVALIDYGNEWAGADKVAIHFLIFAARCSR